MLAGLCVALSVGLIQFSSQPPSFTPAEIQIVKNFWAKPGRYTVVPLHPEAPCQALMTGEGSEWLLHYYHARSPGTRILPTRDPRPENGQQVSWDNWIDRRYDSDFNRAAQEAERMNGRSPATIPAFEGQPEALQSLAGEPPSFFAVRKPMRYSVKFDDFKASMDDGVSPRRKYPYYRYPEGVDILGSAPGSRELNRVLNAAKIGTTAAHVLSAVSNLEGGFASVNTYDTGLVSVGFVQFAALSEGRGSLGELMISMKRNDPKSFNRDFRRFGVDVNRQGYLVVLDPDTGNQFIGPEAASHIIQDKRLTAVFYRAGSISTAFQAAQVRGAMDRFYPGYVQLAFSVNGQSVSGRVSDVFRSEAGLATLMDRYVNIGNINAVAPAIQAIMAKYGYKTLPEASQAETELIGMLRYRRDFLLASNLTNPSSLPPYSATVAGLSAPLTNAPDAVEELIRQASNGQSGNANGHPAVTSLPDTPEASTVTNQPDPKTTKPATPATEPKPVEPGAPGSPKKDGAPGPAEPKKDGGSTPPEKKVG